MHPRPSERPHPAPPPPNPEPRTLNSPAPSTQHQALLLVAAIALLVQILFVLDSSRALSFQIPTVDSASYHAQAMAIAHGKPAPHAPFWQPPLYPYCLALLYGFGITKILAVRLVHGLATVAAALLTTCIARRVTSPRLATAAGLATALYGPLLFYATQLLPTGLATALGLLALLAFQRLTESPSRRRALLCGAAYALAALAVPNILACLLLPLAWLLHPNRQSAIINQKSLVLALLAGAALVILPVTLHNRVVGGEWVLISTNAGINLYIGNNDNTPATLTARPGQDWDRLTEMPYRHGARSAAEAQSFFFGEVFHYLRTQPTAFFRGLLDKAWLLLDSRELPRNTSLYAFRPDSILLTLLTWRIPGFVTFPFGLAGPLALFGLLLTFRAGAPHRLLAAHVALYALTIILFYPAARYRLPLIPPLLIFATLGACFLHSRWTAASGRGRLPTIATLLFFLLLCNFPRTSPTDTLNFDAELHKNLGVGLQVRGDKSRALAEYNRSLQADPRYADALYYRGTLNRDSGRTDDARTDFIAALAARPNHFKTLHDLGVFEYTAGRTALADSLLRRALDVDPRNATIMQALALTALRLGHPDEAEDFLKRAKLATASTPESGP